MFAFMYLVIPLFFAFVIAFYAFKFSFELWLWRKIPVKDRSTYREPRRFVNFNSSLSVKTEWVFVCAGFGAIILSIEYARWST